MRGVKADLKGQRFGLLVVLGAAPSDIGARWQCRCDCGKRVVRRGNDLVRPNWVHSCGCRPALTKSVFKRLRDQGDERLKLLHVEQIGKRG
jgi:hypothetical protein